MIVIDSVFAIIIILMLLLLDYVNPRDVLMEVGDEYGEQQAVRNNAAATVGVIVFAFYLFGALCLWQFCP